MSKEPRSRSAIMRRMASIYAELGSIAQIDMPAGERAKKSELLRQQLAELNRKLCGEQRRRD